MAVQSSVTVRNARLDAVEVTVGTTPKLQIRTGAQPANCAASDTGTLLVEITLPSNWAADAASGAKALAGSWTGSAVATGAPGHYRIKETTGTTTHQQGSASVNGGGGDLDLTISGGGSNIISGGLVTISSFTMNEPNA